MLRHIVSWKLTGETPAEVDGQYARIKSELEALDALVPEIRSISVKRNVLNPGQNFDVAVVADFDNEAGLVAYLVHPAHLEAGSYIKSVTQARACVDFIV